LKKPMQVVGMSISRCIPPLAHGVISVESVEKIVGGTAFKSYQDLWEHYSATYWQDRIIRTRKIFLDLVEAGKIEQPRLTGGTPPHFHRRDLETR